MLPGFQPQRSRSEFASMQVAANLVSNFSQALIFDHGERTVFHGADYKSRTSTLKHGTFIFQVQSMKRVFEPSTVAQVMNQCCCAIGGNRY